MMQHQDVDLRGHMFSLLAIASASAAGQDERTGDAPGSIEYLPAFTPTLMLQGSSAYKDATALSVAALIAYAVLSFPELSDITVIGDTTDVLWRIVRLLPAPKPKAAPGGLTLDDIFNTLSPEKQAEFFQMFNDTGRDGFNASQCNRLPESFYEMFCSVDLRFQEEFLAKHSPLNRPLSLFKNAAAAAPVKDAILTAEELKEDSLLTAHSHTALPNTASQLPAAPISLPSSREEALPQASGTTENFDDTAMEALGRTSLPTATAENGDIH